VKRLLSLTFIIAAVTIFASGCVRKVTVAEVLPIQDPVTTEELVNRINSYSEVKTFSAQAGVLVRNYFTGVGTKAEEFPEGNGAIRLQRPENIRMQVKAPVISSRVADMVSDGRQFRLAIYYPTDKRRFVHGSNLSDLDHLDVNELKDMKDPEIARAGGLVNMRPQHVTDAFLIKPTTANDRTEIFREEVRQEDIDSRSGKKKNRVDRTYYVLYVLERNDKGFLELRRKFWFDRTQKETPLVRQQTFENGGGKVASDIIYSDWFTIPGSGRKWPARVVVDRRYDGYRIELTLEKETVEVNLELPGTTFILENTEGLKEVDLDAPRKMQAAPGRSLQQDLPLR
jgi:hypothetical protein